MYICSSDFPSTAHIEKADREVQILLKEMLGSNMTCDTVPMPGEEFHVYHSLLNVGEPMVPSTAQPTDTENEETERNLQVDALALGRPECDPTSLHLRRDRVEETELREQEKASPFSNREGSAAIRTIDDTFCSRGDLGVVEKGIESAENHVDAFREDGENSGKDANCVLSTSIAVEHSLTKDPVSELYQVGRSPAACLREVICDEELAQTTVAEVSEVLGGVVPVRGSRSASLSPIDGSECSKTEPELEEPETKIDLSKGSGDRSEGVQPSTTTLTTVGVINTTCGDDNVSQNVERDSLNHQAFVQARNNDGGKGTRDAPTRDSCMEAKHFSGQVTQGGTDMHVHQLSLLHNRSVSLGRKDTPLLRNNENGSVEQPFTFEDQLRRSRSSREDVDAAPSFQTDHRLPNLERAGSNQINRHDWVLCTPRNSYERGRRTPECIALWRSNWRSVPLADFFHKCRIGEREGEFNGSECASLFSALDSHENDSTMGNVSILRRRRSYAVHTSLATDFELYLLKERMGARQFADFPDRHARRRMPKNYFCQILGFASHSRL